MKAINENRMFGEDPELIPIMKKAIKDERIILEELRGCQLFTCLEGAFEGQH